MTDSTDNALHGSKASSRADDAKIRLYRRGKQYKCGICHELGHNSKTCSKKALEVTEAAKPIVPAPDSSKPSSSPPRASSPKSTPPIQPTPERGADPKCVPPTTLPLSATDPLLPPVPLENSLSSTVLGLQPGPSGPRPAHERIPPLPLERALAAARRRVLESEQAVANAATVEEYEEATLSLHRSVLALEKVVLCEQRCAAAVRAYNGV